MGQRIKTGRPRQKIKMLDPNRDRQKSETAVGPGPAKNFELQANLNRPIPRHDGSWIPTCEFFERVFWTSPCPLNSDLIFVRSWTVHKPTPKWISFSWSCFEIVTLLIDPVQVFATDPWDHFHKLAPYNISHHNIKGTLLRNRRTILNTITLTLTDYPNRSSSPSNQY